MALLGRKRMIADKARQRFFESRGWRAAEFQQAVWEAMAQGRSGLVHSPTGSGKTLAVALGALSTPTPCGHGILWITPLRALAADLARALEGAMEEVGAGWRVGLWNGDVPASRRRAMARALPEVLITTPESFAVMLSRAEVAAQLARYAVVVVDEWHELLASKRGVLLQLGLAWLTAQNPALLRWGLSATLGNPEEAGSVLGGYRPDGSPRPMEVIRGPASRPVHVEAIMPDSETRLPWAGHLGLALAEAVAKRVQEECPALVFTNTRSQAELWHQALSEKLSASRVALHHSSLDESLRAAAEAGLRSGDLQAVVATSSLDLGVDFPEVRAVFQIGSPKGIARLLQRAGRSGHRPGAKSKIFLVPANWFEVAEIEAARRAVAAGRVEAVRPALGGLDVLCQHALTLAAGGGFRSRQLFEEARQTHAYRWLEEGAWQWVLDYCARGGRALGAYEEFHRLEERGGRWVFRRAPLALRHRMSIGTIASDAEVDVRLRGGRRLGTVEEAFVARLRNGEVFRFGGRLLRLVRVREGRAEVTPAARGSPAVPQWMGGKMPLSTELAESLRAVLAEGAAASAEMSRLRELFDAQAALSALPSAQEILGEMLLTREGFHVFLFPLEGRAVHEGLAALLALRLRRLTGQAFSLAVNDYGLEMLSLREFDAPMLFAEPPVLSDDNLEADVLECINVTELARRRFREIARIAGLAFEGYPGRRKTARQLQISSSLLFDTFEKYDPGHPLVGQAREEVLRSALDLPRLAAALGRLRKGPILWKRPRRITPFAFPLYAERLRESLGSADMLSAMESWLHVARHG